MLDAGPAGCWAGWGGDCQAARNWLPVLSGFPASTGPGLTPIWTLAIKDFQSPLAGSEAGQRQVTHLVPGQTEPDTVAEAATAPIGMATRRLPQR